MRLAMSDAQTQLDRLYRRTTMMVAPVKIVATEDEGPVHRAQVEVNGTPETIDDVAVVQFYGLASHCPVNTDAAALFVSGQRSNAVIIGTNNQKFRLRGLKPGEVALYDDGKNRIALKRDDIIEITCETLIIKADKIEIEAPEITIKGNIELDGDLNATGAINAPRGSVGGGRE
jgi:phage baseplate assembly protein V